MGRAEFGRGVVGWEAELKVDLKRGRGKENVVARVVEINNFRYTSLYHCWRNKKVKSLEGRGLYIK